MSEISTPKACTRNRGSATHSLLVGLHSVNVRFGNLLRVAHRLLRQLLLHAQHSADLGRLGLFPCAERHSTPAPTPRRPRAATPLQPFFLFLFQVAVQLAFILRILPSPASILATTTTTIITSMHSRDKQLRCSIGPADRPVVNLQDVGALSALDSGARDTARQRVWPCRAS